MPNDPIQFAGAPPDTTFIINRPMMGSWLEGFNQAFLLGGVNDVDGDFSAITVTGFTVTAPDGTQTNVASVPGIQLDAQVFGSEVDYTWSALNSTMPGPETIVAHVRIDDLGGASDTQDVKLTILAGPGPVITSGLGLVVGASVIDWSDKTAPVSVDFSYGPGSPSALFAWSPGDQPFPLSFGAFSALPAGMDAVLLDQFSPIDITSGSGADHLVLGFGSATVEAGAGDDYIQGSFSGDVLKGGAGNDEIHGELVSFPFPITGAQDFIYGEDGNDLLEGGPGDDVIDGGNGVDTAQYLGLLYNYTVASTGSQVVVTEIQPNLFVDRPEGQDTLTNVEKLQFNDVTIDLGSPLSLAASAQSNAIVEAGAGGAGVASATISMSASGAAGAVSYELSGPNTFFQHTTVDGQFGTVTLDATTGALTYTLNNSLAGGLGQGQTATDTFDVIVTDGTYTTFAPVSFTVTGAGGPPAAAADSLTTAYATSVTVSAASLLANDTDPDGDSLSVTAVASAQHGTVSLGGGVVTFTPFVGYVGAAGFNYTVDDGHGGTATGQVAVTVTGISPSYIYRAGITAGETIDTTGDNASHSIVTGSGDDAVFTGAGGSSIRLGAGTDVVFGGSGKDIVTFGPGLGTVTGGAGPDNVIFVKGQIADPTTHGGLYDTVTDFTGAGSAYVAGRDFIYLKGFAHTATITYEHDLSGDPTAHLYRVDDGAYHAEFVLDYAGPGVALSHSQYGFL